MSLEENVQPVQSKGGGCAICNVPIISGEYAVRVRFGVSALITTINVDKEMHIHCAEETLVSALIRAAQAARREAGGGIQRRTR